MSNGKTITFSGKGQPGDLLDPNNWVGDVVPGIDDSALITKNIGGPAGGTFDVNNMMLLGSETITFAGILDTLGFGACQGLMVCEGALAIFAPGATLNDGNVVIVGNDGIGALVAQGNSVTRSTINSVTANIGKQDAAVGTVTIDGGVWNNTGHAFIGDDGSGTLNVIDGGAATFGGGVEMGADAGSKGSMTIAGGGSVLVTGSLRVGGAATALINGTASVSVAGSSSLTVDDTLSVDRGDTIQLAGGSVTGGVRTLADGVISGYGTLASPIIQDDGVIRAAGGGLTVSGNVSGTGSVQIAANSTAALTGAKLGLAGIAFVGADATLSLAHGSTVSAAISGFAIGDIIAMANIDAVSFDPSTGKLTLSEHDLKVETLHMTGNFSGDSFVVQQTASGAMITLRHN